MGVHGLWRLIEPSGKPVPLETLENKVLGVDVSIWLHQAVKGFQDSKGAPVPNAHLLGIYHRVCKLLYFRIKPIFVFDGGVPALKRQTISKRTQSKLKNVAEADKIQRQLLSTLLKHTAVSKVLTETIEASIGSIPKEPSRISKDDLYKLPPSGELDSTLSSSEDESSQSATTDSSPTKHWDLHTVDVESSHFKSLPADVRHEILTDLKETRKQSSWGKLHELPKVSDDFSIYQMNRLRKRQAVQAALEEVEKEMGGKSLSLAELESILKDQGVIDNQNVGNRIASDETTKYLLVKDVKKAIEEARKNKLESDTESTVNATVEPSRIDKKKTKADEEYEEELQKAIALSLECEPSTSGRLSDTKVPTSSSSVINKSNKNPADFSFLENFKNEDFASSSSDEELSINAIKAAYKSSAQSCMEAKKTVLTSIPEDQTIKHAKDGPRSSTDTVNENDKEAIVNKDVVGINDKELDIPDPVNEPDCDVEIMSSTDSSDFEIDNEAIKHAKDGPRSSTDTVNENDKQANVNKDVVGINDKQLDIPDLVNEPDCDVEIMSSTDSSDSEIDNNIVDSRKGIEIIVNSKECSETKSENISQKAIDIIINPSEEIEDDLFADIFDSNKNVGSEKDSKIFKENENIGQKAIHIVVNANEFKKDNDVFKKNFTEQSKEAKTHTKTHVAMEEKQTDEIAEGQLERKDSEQKQNTVIIMDKNISQDIKSGETKQDGENMKINEGKKPIKMQKQSMNEQELIKMKNDLQREKIDLLKEKSSKERIAGNITDQMYQEAQELLELFGVPYIIAPMEAEAQCAFLDAIELTDGTITDDSDIWLFGGKTVYKNFFNQSKYVMEFRAENIKHDFKLTREQMILLALLVGSDYTTGIQGIGPVTAVEILAAFPPRQGKINEFSLSHAELLSGLKEFRSWFLKGKSPGPGRNALKGKLNNITFTENFPSSQVVEAYLDPKVETSREAFTWGNPNIMALIEFAKEKFGWTKSKSEDILNPVIKRLEEARHQKSIKDYFKTRFKVHSDQAQSKMSKRVKSAITNMGRDPSEIIAEELELELKKEEKKIRVPRKKNVVEAPEFSKKTDKKKTSSNKKSEKLVKNNDLDPTDAKDFIEGKAPRKPRRTKLKDPAVPSTSQIEQNSIISSEECIEEKVEMDISEKIDLIRKRRKLKDAKAAVDIKKIKLEKQKKIASNQFQEVIPEGLQTDEEVNLLSQIAMDSSQKVDEINKSLQERIDSIMAKSAQVSKPSVRPTPSVSQPSVLRPVSRPTRVPRKEVIPQKEKDKTTLLRNKLKAIEIFRKGKQGPGFIPKKERKKRLPKADAELSENSE